eukprot:2467350-Amphidinium_carterae.1
MTTTTKLRMESLRVEEWQTWVARSCTLALCTDGALTIAPPVFLLSMAAQKAPNEAIAVKPKPCERALTSKSELANCAFIYLVLVHPFQGS